MPIFSCYNMSKRVCKAVLYHFRHSCCTRCEIYKHCVCAFISLITCGAVKCIGKFFYFLLKIQPAVLLFTDNDMILKRFKFRHGFFYLRDNKIVMYAYYRLRSCGICTIDYIFFRKLQSARYCNSTQFMQGYHTYPIFPSPTHDKHNYIAFFDSKRLEIIGSLIGKTAYITESKCFFFIMVITPYKSLFIFVLFCPLIYYVKTEIKVFRYIDFIIFLKILIGIKLYSWQKSVQQHNLSDSFSYTKFFQTPTSSKDIISQPKNTVKQNYLKAI